MQKNKELKIVALVTKEGNIIMTIYAPDEVKILTFTQSESHIVCPSKWSCCLSLKIVMLFVPQNGQIVLPSNMVCHSKWPYNLSAR